MTRNHRDRPRVWSNTGMLSGVSRRISRARLGRVVVLILFWTWAAPGLARADWLVTPFVGLKVDGRTNLIDLDQAAGAAKVLVGGSVALLGSGPLGVEMDVGYTHGFFDSNTRGALVVRSHVSTLTGNVLIAVPASVTRESLRPYLVGGVGLMHAGIGDVLNLFPISSNFLAFDVGGGATGALTPRSSVRFDLRRFQNLTEKTGVGAGFGPSRLSFWRATVGLTFRY